ncbi:HEAT repeat-containing protein 4, partial [Rhizoclosmatium hyalinum]
MWNDWSREVRASATKTLAKLNQGKQAFDYIISLLEMADPSKKIDALRCLNGMGVITSSAMSVYLTTFKDTYFSVRIEACKVACGIVTAENRVLVNTLLDCLNDYDDKVRAYSVKGLSKCKEPRIREALYWCLIHDKCPSVRAESIHSIVELKLLQEDVTLRESIFVIMDTDNDEGVRREAERALIKGGFLFDGEKARAAQTPPTTDKIAASAENTGPELGETISVAENSPTNDEMETSSDKHETGKTVAAVPGMTFLPQDSQSKQPAKRTPMAQASSTPKKLSKDGKTRVPQSVLPDAIKGMPDEDVELYFRECLVGEAEQQAVIDQVRDMSTASIVLQEVEQMDKDSSTLPELGLDLEFRK